MSILRGLAIPIGVAAAILLVLLFNPWLVIEDADPPPDLDGRLLDLLHRAASGAVRGSKKPRKQGDRDRGPGIHAVPLRQLTCRAVLAADPPLRRLRLARGRVAQVHRPGMDARRGRATSLLGAGRRDPGEGRPPITFEWYRDFINTLLNANAERWMAWVVTLGELAVGIGLILGLLTGVAAFFGALMNMSFLLAGSASTNPVLFTLAIGLILAWKVAGYYGLDRYLLPMLGTPWRPGSLVHRGASPAGHRRAEPPAQRTATTPRRSGRPSGVTVCAGRAHRHELSRPCG